MTCLGDCGRKEKVVMDVFLCWEFVLINKCGLLGSLLRNLTGGSWPNSKHNVTVLVGLDVDHHT